jgi:hypothetical protein
MRYAQHNVRFGSVADITAGSRYVRFAPKRTFVSALSMSGFVPEADMEHLARLSLKLVMA